LLISVAAAAAFALLLTLGQLPLDSLFALSFTATDKNIIYIIAVWDTCMKFVNHHHFCFQNIFCTLLLCRTFATSACCCELNRYIDIRAVCLWERGENLWKNQQFAVAKAIILGFFSHVVDWGHFGNSFVGRLASEFPFDFDSSSLENQWFIWRI
jgi:hypothetical protein